jgi:hypothetical protein
MAGSRGLLRKRVAGLVLSAAVLAAGGCGGAGKLDSVSGKVTLDGQSLAGVVVNYIPDTKKGNNTTLGVSGFTDANGSYYLKTSTRNGHTYTGAPPGWYRVTVVPGVPGPGAKPVQVPSRYGSPTSSPFQIEVVDSPKAGAYDLPLVTK